MQASKLIEQVRQRTQLDSQSAEIAIRATLETLGERTVNTNDLTIHVPPAIAAYLQSAWVEGDADFSIEEFFQAVSQREGVELTQAINHALAVIDVLDESVPQNELKQILEEAIV